MLGFQQVTRDTESGYYKDSERFLGFSKDDGWDFCGFQSADFRGDLADQIPALEGLV